MYTKYTSYRGDFLTVQKGNVCASSWMDRKVVTVMSTTSQPDGGSVLRQQKDGTRIPVPCPLSIIDYNNFMGGVDRGDQVRGYYSCRTKCRKFYKYIFHFSARHRHHEYIHPPEGLLWQCTIQEYQSISATAGKPAHW